MSEDSAPAPKPKKSVALSGVVAGNTALCTVGRTGNDLHYRGYDILDFADQAEFEEIAYLLVHEKLPTRGELAAYKKKLQSLRALPRELRSALENIPERARCTLRSSSTPSMNSTPAPSPAASSPAPARTCTARSAAASALCAARSTAARTSSPTRFCPDIPIPTRRRRISCAACGRRRSSSASAIRCTPPAIRATG